MRRLIWICLFLLLSVVSMSALGHGTTLVTADGVVTQDTNSQFVNSWMIAGWSFHSNGAAITKWRVDLDGQPFADESMGSFYGIPRPDVVSAYAYYGITAPSISGINIFMAWSPLSVGSHTAQICVQDAEYGATWTCSNAISFTKS